MTEQQPRPPAELGRDAFVCPWDDCGTYAAHIWSLLSAKPYPNNNIHEAIGVAGAPRPLHALGMNVEDDTWRTSRCTRCDRTAMWHGRTMVWPAQRAVGPPPHPDMIDSVREVYEEGRQVAGISRRAGTALLRASLERMVKSEVPGGGKSLNDKIGALQARVRPGLHQALDVLRDAGNGILHDEVPEGVAALVIDEADDGASDTFGYLCDVVNRLTEELISQPRRDDEMFSKLSDGVRAGIRRRDTALPDSTT